ncbi:MAG: DUF4411 family protein [Patescibacteria group bacterium]|nr:DUF4411 family protein [Patescibacteria group bacterium]MDD5294481.1 DUF4411 family protein [Patescibacteria group bacterium]MDD5554403.1 DUF4411 family protein [Patescibacteria group bacterium]
MAEDSKKLVIDNNSLVNFFNYYFFDRDYSGEIYKKLRDFLLDKIKSGEIIIIDRVFKEFTTIKSQQEIDELRKYIKPFFVNTVDLIDDVQILRDKYYKPENERYYRDQTTGKVDYNLIDRVLNLYLDKHADLYLAAYCMAHSDSILVTDESFKKDNKLIEKLPTICSKEKIKLIDLPNSLFNYYKDELIFKLN